MNFMNPLPFDLDKYMPSDRETPLYKYRWREEFYNYLESKDLLIFDEEGELIGVKPFAHEIEQVNTNNEENKVVTKKAKSEPKKKTIPKTDDKSVEKTNEYECIRYMPAEAMNALRAVFPYSLSKTELLLTAIYIITNGGIDVPEKVIKAAKTYKDDKLTAIEERLSRIERINNIALNRMYAVELCSSYIVYDMIYGLRGARSGPEKEVFRTMGNLELLECLREQAKEQQADDEMKQLNGK